MTLAEIVLPPSRGARALSIAAASAAILAAVWIFQAIGYPPCELCLTQRYAFYAAVPLALLSAFLASRSAPGLARTGFALLALIFAANAALAAYHTGVEYHWWPGPTACTGGPGSLDVNDLVKALEFGQGGALRRSPAAYRRTVACRLERRGECRSGRLRCARRAVLRPTNRSGLRETLSRGRPPGHSYADLVGRNLDLDLQCRDRVRAVHLHR